MMHEHNIPFASYEPIRQKPCARRVKILRELNEKMKRENDPGWVIKSDLRKIAMIVPIFGLSFAIAAVYGAGKVQNLPWAYLVGSGLLIALWGVVFLPILRKIL